MLLHIRLFIKKAVIKLVCEQDMIIPRMLLLICLYQ